MGYLTIRSGFDHLVGGAPVSVAYCDRTDCIRTYTGPGAEPLRVRIAGIKDGGLVVKLDGVYYDHRSGRVVEGPPGAAPLPHDRVPWTRATWGGWRREHPATDVSVGSAAAPTRVEPEGRDVARPAVCGRFARVAVAARGGPDVR